MILDSKDETNFLHELLLTDKQVSRLRKVFSNGSSSNIKFSKTQLSKMVQLRAFLLPTLGPTLAAAFKEVTY